MESPFRRVPSRRRFPRRSSVSNLGEEVPQPSPSGPPGSLDVLAKREHSGENGPCEDDGEPSVRSQEGDTEARPDGVVVGGRADGGGTDEPYEVFSVDSVLRHGTGC